MAAALVAGACLADAAVAENVTPPSIGGSFRQGSTLSVSAGTWTFTPTGFTYEWQRCDLDGTGCTDIARAAGPNYTLVAADVTHTIVVNVTASNAFASDDATTDPTSIIATANPPADDVQPAISGNAAVGQTLTVSNGSWIPPASAFSYQWQLCAGDGSDCLDIPTATKSSFKIVDDDAAHTLRVLVTAQTAAGEIATAHSNTTGKVVGGSHPAASGTPATATTPAAAAPHTPGAARPPTLTLRGLRHTGKRIVASFRVCGGDGGAVTLITARDSQGKAPAHDHRFIVNVSGCANLSRNWVLVPRSRTGTRLVVTMQALDQTGKQSKAATRSLAL